MARIQDVPQPDDPRRVQRAQERRTEESRETAKTETAATDRVDVSNEARDAENLRATLSSEVKNVPDVREDRVAAAKEKLASGELDSEEARRASADSLLEQFGL